jgi:very-short-patch-repair endonuclease
VYDALEARGYTVRTQVGCSGYRIDLAIEDPRNPGKFLLGIECDGAQYHASQYARDRDRIRQAVLESLGWKIYRIWSDRWLRCKDEILDEIEHLVSSPPDEGKGNNVSFSKFEECQTLKKFNPQRHYPEYKEASVEKRHYVTLDLSPEYISTYDSAYLECANVITRILEVEAPITREHLMRKTLSAFGIKRMTGNISRKFDMILDTYNRIHPIRIEHETVFCNCSGPLSPVRLSIDEVRPFDYIPIQELAQAILDLIDSCPLNADDVIREVPSGIYGYKRTGGKIRSRMLSAIEYLAENELIK